MKRKLTSFLCLIALICSLCTAALAADSSVTVSVDNVSDFLSAIAPNTTIVLEPGVYNLYAAKNYGSQNTGDYYKWTDLIGDYGLLIEGVENLTIIGYDAEIVTEPRFPDVIRFSHCYGLTLKGLTLGHTEGTEPCEGGVLYLDRCDRFRCEDCSFYGCGTVGISLYGCYDAVVSGADIHHCSSTGVYVYNSEKIRFEKLTVHDCASNVSYSRAWSVFSFYNSSDISFSSSEICNNIADNLFTGSSERIDFDGLAVHDNSFEYLVGFSGRINIENISLTDNIIYSWFDNDFNNNLVINGQIPSSAQLDDRYPGQSMKPAAPTVPIEFADIITEGCREIHVSTADEFISAIADDTLIVIDVPQIDLTTASDYGKDSIEPMYYNRVTHSESAGRSYIWTSEFDGYGLWICGVRNLHIRGGEIITQPRYVNVLSFSDCMDTTIDGVKLGHSPDPGFCSGGVLNLSACSNFVISGCDLYGCGTVGVMAEDCSGLVVQGTLIHDCSFCAAEITGCFDVTFTNVSTKNIPSMAFRFRHTCGLVFNGSVLEPNCSFD